MNIYDIIKITDSNINKKLYNGSEKKLGVTIGEKDYIMKFRKRDWNNIESEYIASNVISILGGDAHRVYLGCYRNDLVALCLDFTQFYDSSYLQSLRSISSSMLDTDKSQHDYFFNDVIYLFKSLRNCDVEYNKDKFIRMYIYDALLGNTDRHAGNWGLVNKNGKWVFAPIFDSGASLFPRVKINTVTENWVKERVFTFPNSKIMFNDKRERSSYYNVISANEELRKYTQIIDEDKLSLVYTFIDCAPIRSELKSLYKTMIHYRYECIIKQNDFIWKGAL